ncbi:hypothetical protein [Chitinophaga sancti]|uniref:hypothetical protein n=1 Tax=Chitinophaga sancti TaxID=1004 RepID=UPI003F79C773
MKIGQPFKTLSLQQYFYYIDNHKKYTDFNTLGLYRSIVENEKLSPADKIAVREYAHRFFKKSFDFLQLKDPRTFIEVEFLGQELTKGDNDRIWEDIKKYQQRILTNKRIKHRNFGMYSKHLCGYDNCHLNGLMIRRDSPIAQCHMHFESDQRGPYHYNPEAYKADRKRERQIIRKELENE